MTLILKYTAYSDKGLLRKNNEDSVYAGQRLLALADGMGGHVGGEIASSLVISSLTFLDADEPETDILAQLRAATNEANNLLAKKVHENSFLEGMGTTLTALLFTGTHLALSHVGDSRAYRLRNKKLTLLTRDDTLIQILVENGQIDFHAAQTHPKRSLILKALTGEKVEPTVELLDIQLGDRYLLCSDGLTDIVPIEDICKILYEEDIDIAAQQLIQRSLSAGAPDNVTVLLADITEGVQSEDQPILAGAIVDDKLGHQLTAETAPLPFFYRPHKYKLRALPILMAVMIFSVLLGGYAFESLKTNFFLGIENQRVVIFQGVNWQLFNIRLSRPYLHVCLHNNSDAHPTVVFNKPQCACTSLTLNNLSPTRIQSLHDLPKSNTLEQTKNQAISLATKLTNMYVTAYPNSSKAPKVLPENSLKNDYCPNNPNNHAHQSCVRHEH